MTALWNTGRGPEHAGPRHTYCEPEAAGLSLFPRQVLGRMRLTEAPTVPCFRLSVSEHCTAFGVCPTSCSAAAMSSLAPKALSHAGCQAQVCFWVIPKRQANNTLPRGWALSRPEMQVEHVVERELCLSGHLLIFPALDICSQIL